MLIPYEAAVPMRRYPWANITLIAITTIVSLIAIADRNIFNELTLGQLQVPQFVKDFPILKTLPDHPRDYPVTYKAAGYLTYGFVHGGIMHLVGNMIFLFVFGNAVNAKIGHLRYLLLFAALLAASGAVQVRMMEVVLPICGASGAIYGIMGMFIVLYPRNEISCAWFAFYRLTEHLGSFEIASIWIVLYWVLCDVVMLKLDLAGNIGVHAHLAGFTFGAAMAILAVLVRLIKSDDYEENLLEVFGMSQQWQKVEQTRGE